MLINLNVLANHCLAVAPQFKSLVKVDILFLPVLRFISVWLEDKLTLVPWSQWEWERVTESILALRHVNQLVVKDPKHFPGLRSSMGIWRIMQKKMCTVVERIMQSLLVEHYVTDLQISVTDLAPGDKGICWVSFQNLSYKPTLNINLCSQNTFFILHQTLDYTCHNVLFH